MTRGKSTERRLLSAAKRIRFGRTAGVGQSQAMACARAAVVNRTAAVWLIVGKVQVNSEPRPLALDEDAVMRRESRDDSGMCNLVTPVPVDDQVTAQRSVHGVVAIVFEDLF